MPPDVSAAIDLLNEHHRQFWFAQPFADATGHTVPSDTKSWSQILVSLLTGIPGRGRQKGSDLADGSDVKAANLWCAIDTPRFNGCIPAGRTSVASMKPGDVSALDETPHLFFVLWDERLSAGILRCRVWVVSPQRDLRFRQIAGLWYEKRERGEIISSNFQLHPPRNQDHNMFNNACGNLEYPLMFAAELHSNGYETLYFNDGAMFDGQCV